MILRRLIDYYFDGYWHGYDKSMTFTPKWNGVLFTEIEEHISNKNIDSFIFECGVRYNLFTEKNKPYLKNIKKISFYTDDSTYYSNLICNSKESEHYCKQMFIPSNIKEINIYYKDKYPDYTFHFVLDNIETKINYHNYNNYILEYNKKHHMNILIF